MAVAAMNSFDRPQRQTLQWIAVGAIIVTLIGLYGLLGILIIERFDEFRNQVMAHVVTIIGLAGMGMAALLLVIIFKQTDGPVEFEAGWIKFKGAAGPVVLWIIVFLAMVGGARMLWQLN